MILVASRYPLGVFRRDGAVVLVNILFCLYDLRTTEASQSPRPHIFDASAYAKDHARYLLVKTMRTYYETSLVRISDIKELRFMYEESPHYEQGYLLGEIIERYRKSVEHVRLCEEVGTSTVLDCLKRAELLQKLHFEIFHLCNMMHEIELKYKSVIEFGASAAHLSLEHIWKLEKQMRFQQKQRMKAKKKEMKLKAELNKLQSRQKNQRPGAKPVKYNLWWPTDYGWEISYYW